MVREYSLFKLLKAPDGSIKYTCRVYVLEGRKVGGKAIKAVAVKGLTKFTCLTERKLYSFKREPTHIVYTVK